MKKELEKDLETKILSRPPNNEEVKFRMIFLLDDFSGSGISYFRKDLRKNRPTGKIKKIIGRFAGVNGDEHDLQSIVNLDDLQIWVILAVSTNQAIERLQNTTTEWLRDEGLNIKINITAIQIIPESVKIDPKRQDGIVNLLMKYFDSDVIDGHYQKGRYEKPFLGFDECALPLILSHNTPNNSLPLLWFEPSQSKYHGLFPRVSRHKEE